MKYIQSMIVLIGIIFCLGTVVSSCMDSDKKVDNVSDTVKAAKDKFEENRKELSEEMKDFKMKLNQKYEYNKAELIKYRNDKKRMAEASYKKNVETLEIKNEMLKSRIDETQTSAAVEWENLKNELDHEMNDLEKSVKEFNKKL